MSEIVRWPAATPRLILTLTRGAVPKRRTHTHYYYYYYYYYYCYYYCY